MKPLPLHKMKEQKSSTFDILALHVKAGSVY